MHPSVMAWVSATLTQADITGRRVLEVGSYDVNGTVRPIIEAFGPTNYLGVDMQAGPGVDRVVDATELAATFGADSFDVVVSTELLEHAADWRAVLIGMATVLRPGGLLVLTTRSPGFGRHEFPSDHWRYTVETMSKILDALGFGSHEISPDAPEFPGVLVKARKSSPWVWNPAALEAIKVDPAPVR